MATLTIDNVKKSFGKVDVIHGVSIEIEDGEFIVIVGPSGCGKSTLLRLVAGLETITDGKIAINNERVNEKEPMDRDIAMVFQNYALYPHMSVRDNMAYGLKISKTPKQEIERKVNEAAELLQLRDYLNRKPRQLSGGQRQRVAMGRAIVREPAVFLFDEPLSNLDAKLRVQMRLEIKQLQAKLGVTSLYVTHDQVEAMTMADRMIVMNDGRAEQIGTPLEVYEQPATLFAAQFIGSPAMNLLHAEMENGIPCLANGTRLPAALISSDLSNHKGSVALGIRPEHLDFSPAPAATGTEIPQQPLEININFAEPLGATTLVYGTLAHTDIPLSVSIPGVFNTQSIGASQHLSLFPQQIHVFHPETGARL